MNYVSRFNGGYFYAQGVGGSVGMFQKSPIAQSLLSVDYSGVLGTPNPPNIGGNVGIVNLAFILDTQSVPPLVISSPTVVGQRNIAQFIVSGGFGGVEYDISINAFLSDKSSRVDILALFVTGGECDACGCDPCSCSSGCFSTMPEQQVATLATNQSTFGNSFPQYYVSPNEPTPANLLDRWYNTTNNAIYDYISDGTSSFWQIANVSSVPTNTFAMVNDIPPSLPENGALWFDSVRGQLYVWYNDGSSAQWVIATNRD